MCLKVLEVPTKYGRSLVHPCIKPLFKSYMLQGSMVTYYRQWPVPNTGWLFPETKLRPDRELFLGQVVGLGIIHADPPKSRVHMSDYRHPAFMVGVRAWGTFSGYQGMVGDAVYIPDCDVDKDRRTTTVEELTRLTEVSSPASIRKLHPKLRGWKP